jgi:3-hydroxybutyrate dehydrogenase
VGELDGRVALVTGAAGGLGRAICEVFRREGASVLPVDLHGDDVFQADVSTREGNDRIVAESVRLHGTLDVLVLNAGAQYMAPLAEFPTEKWNQLVDLMLNGPAHAIKAAWPYLTEKPDSRIIATGSSLSIVAEAYKAAYVSAKHALYGLIKVAALEGAKHSLCANLVAPGLMWTQLMEDQIADQMRLHGLDREQILERIDLFQPGRAVTVMEVAETMSFLASPRASGISGACIPVDLGALSV